MSVVLSVVGAGRLGRGIARRLRQLGWKIGTVVTRSGPSARAAVRAIGGGSAHGGLTRSLLSADVVLVAVPDDALRCVAAQLAHMGGEEWRGKVILHSSGAHGYSALEALARCGAFTGSLHPMQTFSAVGGASLENVVFGIEGHSRARQVARRIARELGGIPITLPEKNKAQYHAAGTLAASLGLGLMEAATELLMNLGFSRRQAARALLPLVRQMLGNLARFGPRASWTGPLSRGDYDTVEAHLKILQRFPPEFQEAYLALARLSARVLASDAHGVLRKLEAVAAPYSQGEQK